MANAPKKAAPLLLLIFIDTVGYFIVLPVVIKLFMPGMDSLLPSNTQMGTRDLLFSITLALSPIAFIVFSPILGHLSDRYGRKNTLIAAILAAIAGFGIPIAGILTKHISLIFIGRFIAGASSSSQPLAQAAITDFTTGKQRAFYLSLIGLMMTLGMVIGPLSGTYLSDSALVHWFNPTTPYLFATLLSCCNLWLIVTCFKDDMQHKAPATHAALAIRLTHLWHIIRQKTLLWLLLIFFFMEIAWAQYYQSLFLVLPQYFHYTVDALSLFTAYIGLWMCLGLTVVYKILLKRYAIKHLAQWSIITALAGLCLCNIPNMTVQWIAMIPVALAIGVAYPSLLALISAATDDTHQGYVLGSASTLLGLAWMGTGLLVGVFLPINPQLPTFVATVAMLLAAYCQKGLRYNNSGQ